MLQAWQNVSGFDGFTVGVTAFISAVSAGLVVASVLIKLLLRFQLVR